MGEKYKGKLFLLNNNFNAIVDLQGELLIWLYMYVAIIMTLSHWDFNWASCDVNKTRVDLKYHTCLRF